MAASSPTSSSKAATSLARRPAPTSTRPRRCSSSRPRRRSRISAYSRSRARQARPPRRLRTSPRRSSPTTRALARDRARAHRPLGGMDSRHEGSGSTARTAARSAIASAPPLRHGRTRPHARDPQRDRCADADRPGRDPPVRRRRAGCARCTSTTFHGRRRPRRSRRGSRYGCASRSPTSSNPTPRDAAGYAATATPRTASASTSAGHRVKRRLPQTPQPTRTRRGRTPPQHAKATPASGSSDQTQRASGSLHSDIWDGTAADLAERGAIAVYPVTGWWKERKTRDHSDRGARYALVVSIETPGQDVDIWTPVAQQIGIEVAIET